MEQPPLRLQPLRQGRLIRIIHRLLPRLHRKLTLARYGTSKLYGLLYNPTITFKFIRVEAPSTYTTNRQCLA